MASQNLQYNPYFNGITQCSSGFQIQDSSGNYFTTTAGHCGWYGGGFAQNSLQTPNGTYGWWIGGVVNDSWNWLYTCTVTGSGPSNISGTQTFTNDCSNGDALAIGEWSGAASNKLLVSATFTGNLNSTMTYSNILRVTAEEGWNGDVAGGTYCRSSINDNGYICGTELWHNIAERYYNPADNNLTATFPYMRVMNFAGHSGDSGSPYFQLGGPNGGVIAVGLHAGGVGGDGTDAFFSQIHDAETELGAVHVVTNTLG